MKHSLCVVALILVAFCTVAETADGAGECGRVPVERMAIQLAPCAMAAQNEQVQVSSACCSAVHKLGQNPVCLCAVMLSDTARIVGTKPEIAVTIPKRCNLVDRPIGYKCGAYTLP